MSPESKHILDKVSQEEPIFILRAQDTLAVYAVNFWVNLAKSMGVNEAKILSAQMHAAAMKEWQICHPTKRPD